MKIEKIMYDLFTNTGGNILSGFVIGISAPSLTAIIQIKSEVSFWTNLFTPEFVLSLFIGIMFLWLYIITRNNFLKRIKVEQKIIELEQKINAISYQNYHRTENYLSLSSGLLTFGKDNSGNDKRITFEQLFADELQKMKDFLEEKHNLTPIEKNKILKEIYFDKVKNASLFNEQKDESN